MTRHMRIPLAAIAVFLAGSSIAWASEPNDSGIPLKFEVKSTAIGPLSPRRAGDPQSFGPWRPTYAAGIPFEGGGRYLNIVGAPAAGEFIRTALKREGLSTTQKEFLQATQDFLRSERQGGPIPQWRSMDDADGSRQLLLYAMTLEDAKGMAEAFTGFVLEKWRRNADIHKGYIKEFEGRITAAQQRIGELEKAIEDSEQTLNSLKQKLPYRTEKEAMEAIAELDRMLNAAQVDIAGIQSKIKATQDYLRSGELRKDEAIRAKLQVMFVEESIALQGAEARKKMATQLRTDANRFLDVQQSLANAKRETAELQEKITVSREEASKAQHRWELVMTEKPQITDHTVAIYPVRWVAESEDGLMGPPMP